MYDFQGLLTEPDDTHCQPAKAEKDRFTYMLTLSVTVAHLKQHIHNWVHILRVQSRNNDTVVCSRRQFNTSPPEVTHWVGLNQIRRERWDKGVGVVGSLERKRDRFQSLMKVALSFLNCLLTDNLTLTFDWLTLPCAKHKKVILDRRWLANDIIFSKSSFFTSDNSSQCLQ